MSKVTMSTDWHFGKSNGKFDNIILKGIEDQCNHAKQNNITTMINMGDILDVKQTISTNTLNYLSKAFEIVNETFNTVYVIVGNHDLSKKGNHDISKNTYDTNSHNLRIFNAYSNVKVIDEPKIYEILGKKFYLLPYLPNEIMLTHNFPKANYLCGHLEVQGFMLNQFIKAEHGIDEQLFTNMYDHVFLGHFHKKQNKGNLSYIGNLCRFFYGENDDERGWTILDVNTNEIEFIEYNHPRMYKFNISTIIKEDDLSTIFNPGDNVKLVIDTNLKYSELEEFKSKLILEYKINDLVLDDQYFAWSELDTDNEDEEEEDTDIKSKQNQTYMEYVLNEMIKSNKNDANIEERESIKFLRELSKQYQE